MPRIPTRALCLAVLLALGAAVAATPAQAQTSPEEMALLRRAHRYSEAVMSPFCPGRTLTDCPSPSAAMLRERIKTWMRQGLTDDQIMQELRRLHGDVVIAVPRNPVEWTLPVLLLTSGLGVLGFTLYRVTQRRTLERRHIAIPKELEKRLDAELRSHGF